MVKLWVPWVLVSLIVRVSPGSASMRVGENLKVDMSMA